MSVRVVAVRWWRWWWGRGVRGAACSVGGLAAGVTVGVAIGVAGCEVARWRPALSTLLPHGATKEADL